MTHKEHGENIQKELDNLKNELCKAFNPIFLFIVKWFIERGRSK